MNAFVLDASMALAWHFRDEVNDRARAVSKLFDTHVAVVPNHWFAEIANGLLVGERRKRTNPQESARFFDRLATFEIDVDLLLPDEVAGRLLPLARAHRLTIYDTLYLELAERRGLPLASLDSDLNEAAMRVGIPLVEYAS